MGSWLLVLFCYCYVGGSYAVLEILKFGTIMLYGNDSKFFHLSQNSYQVLCVIFYSVYDSSNGGNINLTVKHLWIKIKHKIIQINVPRSPRI